MYNAFQIFISLSWAVLNYFSKGKASCIQDKSQGKNLPDRARMAERKDDL